MNNAKVKVRAYAGPDAELQGKVVVPSKKNPEYGSILVEQSTLKTNGGFMERVRRTAFINGTVEDLKSAGFVAGQEIEGKIVVKEQQEPFNTENPDMDIKLSGANGIPCMKDGKPIYRRTFYTLDESEQDVTIEHDNKAEISAHRLSLQESKDLEEG